MSTEKAYAKINLALVVGPMRADGKHEVVTLLQRIALHDAITLVPAGELTIEGFDDDTLVRDALQALGKAAGGRSSWRVHIDKHVPVAAGLGGGSSDAATALRLANATLAQPLADAVVHRLAARLGADVPFFLGDGPKLATADGTELAPLELPSEYTVVLVLPHGATKSSTGSVYAAFAARNGAHGFRERVARLEEALGSVSSPRDLGLLPPNDLASSPLASELEAAGAFRSDVSGAGPTVYGLFERESDATRAVQELGRFGRTMVTRPVGAADMP